MTDDTPGPRCRDCRKPLELDRGLCPSCQAASWIEIPPEHPLWGLLNATEPRRDTKEGDDN